MILNIILYKKQVHRILRSVNLFIVSYADFFDKLIPY